MPNVKELQSIVNYALFQPAIDPIFGPTRPVSGAPNYWSSTTYANQPSFALIVNFDTGYTSDDGKLLSSNGRGQSVRAVRHGH